MKSRIMRNGIRSIVIVLLLLILFILFLLTPYGFTSSMWMIKKALPGELTYQQAKGALVGPVDMTNFVYSTKQFTLKAQQLHFNWDPLFLTKKTLMIQDLKMDHVQFILHKQADNKLKESKQPKEADSVHDQILKVSKLSLPFKLQIENGKLQDIKIINLLKKPVFVNYFIVQGTLSNENMNFNMETSVRQPQPIFSSFSVNGDINHYKLKMLVRSRAFRWHLKGEGGQRYINLVTNDGHVLGGSINGKININLHEGLHWLVNLNVNQVKLREINENYPANLNLKLNSQGNVVKRKPDITMVAAIQVPSGHINIKAHITEKVQATWDIAVANLHDVWKSMRGSLISKGKFSGSLKHPVSVGLLRMQKFHFQQYRFKKLNSHWDIKDSAQVSSTFKLCLQSLHVGTTSIPTVSIAIHGNRRHQRMVAAIKMAAANIEAKINGDYDQRRWKIVAPLLSMRSKIFDNWSLRSPLELIGFDNGDFLLAKSCLHSSSRQIICINGDRKSDVWKLHAHGNNLKVKDYLVFNHRNIKVHGRTSLNVDASGNQDQFQNANLKVHFDKGYVNYFINGQQHYRLYVSGDVDTELKDNNIRSHVRFNFQKKDFIALDLQTTQGKGAHFGSTTPFKAKLNVMIHNLGFISNYIPSVGITEGSLKVNIGAHGAIGDPLYNGNVSIRTAVISIPSAGLELTQLALDFNVVNSIAHAVIHTLSSGNPLKIEGTADFRKDTFGTKLHLTGNSTLVVNMPNYKVFATPDIKFDYTHHQASVKGTLTIPTATLKLQQSVSVVSMPTHEIEYVGPKVEKKKSSTIFNLDLYILIKKAVHIEAYGLFANLEGKLHLFTSDKGVMLADGRIAVLNGQFAAYGHSLSIANQSFIEYIQSPVDNPYLNVRAYKDVKVLGGLNPQQFNFESMVVGIIVTGHPSNMKVDLYSQPPGMSQEDILSYLLFGYSGGGSTGSSSQIAGALAKGGSGLGAIPNKFQQTLGLAELGFEDSTVSDAGGNAIGQQSAFVLGKQISRQLYLRYVYNYGFYQPGSVFQIRYYLGKRWVIQGDVGDYGEGMDALYSMQSNK